MSILRECIKVVTRSNGWRRTRKHHLNKQDQCEVCSAVKGLEVHHKMPFHIDPTLELDPENLITLCRRHHFSIGHLEDWDSYNGNLEETIKYFKSLLTTRLK